MNKFIVVEQIAGRHIWLELLMHSRSP